MEFVWNTVRLLCFPLLKKEYACNHQEDLKSIVTWSLAMDIEFAGISDDERFEVCSGPGKDPPD